MDLNRREALLKFLFGAGYVGLRSLATGLPIAVLANPRKAFADGAAALSTGNAQYIVMSGSTFGDPINANVPGTYIYPGVAHPSDPAMAPTSMTIGGSTYQTAAVWATLPASRTCFFHASTNTEVHPDQANVMELNGEIATREMLPSFIARHTAPMLGTVQPAPICLGAAEASEALSFEGSPQPMLSPASLASILSSPTGPLANLQKIRDADLNAMNAFFKARGHAAQAAFIDQYAQSQSQVRNISQTLLSQLQGITGNGPTQQLQAAVILIQMKLAPIFTVHLPFGGDNHSDPSLADEVKDHVSSLANINMMLSLLQAAGLQDQVTFATLNVFGRTMGDLTLSGRSHNGGHQASVMIGSTIRGSVIGGIKPSGGDFECLPIESSTGAGSTGGDISAIDTLGAYAMTLSAAAGVPATTIAQNIRTGAIINAALVQS